MITSRMALLLASLFGLLVLAGCTGPMTRAECEAGDWYSVGYSDATQGRPANFLAQNVASCSKLEDGAAVVPDQAEYMRGREDGLRFYCTQAGVYWAALGGNELDLTGCERLRNAGSASFDASPLPGDDILRSSYSAGVYQYQTTQERNHLRNELLQYQGSWAGPAGPWRGRGPWGWDGGWWIERRIQDLDFEIARLEGKRPLPKTPPPPPNPGEL